MKLNTLLGALCVAFCLIFSTTALSAQTTCVTPLVDFEDGVAWTGAFGGASIVGVVPDPTDPTNMVLEMFKGDPEPWAGISENFTLDFTTDSEICVDFWEQDATGTLLIKLELGVGAANWEKQVATTAGWNTYCVDTCLPSDVGGNTACGFEYGLLAIFPDFGTCCTNQEYYLDNVCIPTVPIPTVGQWGLLCLSIMFLSIGAISVRNEQEIAIA